MIPPVSREQLQQWKRAGLTDAEIGDKLGVVKNTVFNYRRKLRVAADGEHWDWQAEPCRNPDCGTRSANRYIGGLCGACYRYRLRTGRQRTKADMYTPGGGSGYCEHCGHTSVQARNLCSTCLRYWYDNGEMRPRYLVERGPCRTCGKPYVKNSFVRGYCPACHSYRERNGRERPWRLWGHINWCECGNEASHEVELAVLSGEGYQRTETYWLCDDCYAEETEVPGRVEVPRNGRIVGASV